MHSEPAFPAHIFRAYDIRGLYPQELDEDLAEKIGFCFARWLRKNALCRDGDLITVGSDVRPSSPSLKYSFIQGVNKAGLNARDVGTVATGVLFFAVAHDDAPAGAMITASHNPKEFNGVKPVARRAKGLTGEWGIYELRDAARSAKLPAEIQGMVEEEDVSEAYENWVLSHATLAKPVSVVVDCGNGATGPFAIPLLEKLGCRVTALYAEPDGTFPNHSPDPTNPDAIRELQQRVVAEKADFGVALDGDGDRAIFVDETGSALSGDLALALFAQSLLEKQPGATIVHEVLCSRAVPEAIRAAGGRPVVSRVGHSYINDVMEREKAALGGEISGHYFFAENYGYDDGMFAAAKMAELVSHKGSLKKLRDALPKYVSSPGLRVKVENDVKKFAIVEAVREDFGRAYGKNVTTLDGVRLDADDAWGLVRASNTAPELSLRFEAKTQAGLEKMRALFAQALEKHGVKIERE